MKNYKVDFADFGNDPEILDLVNILDDNDRIMLAPNEFFIGEEVKETDIYTKECGYTYTEGVTTGKFAFKKN